MWNNTEDEKVANRIWQTVFWIHYTPSLSQWHLSSSREWIKEGKFMLGILRGALWSVLTTCTLIAVRCCGMLLCLCISESNESTLLHALLKLSWAMRFHFIQILKIQYCYHINITLHHTCYFWHAWGLDRKPYLLISDQFCSVQQFFRPNQRSQDPNTDQYQIP